MRILNAQELKAFEHIATRTESQLLKMMSVFLENKYKNIITTPSYIYAVGDIPIALVAHLDTVFPTQPADIFYDRIKNVLWSPDGLGADDRAGVFAIIQILKTGLRPSIIFTIGEELGGIGASTLIHNIPKPYSELRYMIQLDRCGSSDCVFYNCDNWKFEKYVEKFGFITSIGSFSDISIICPYWGIAGVNLSVGYYDEHSISEILCVNQLFATINKVITMLREIDIPSFEYIQVKRNAYNFASGLDYTFNTYQNNDLNVVNCHHCKKQIFEIDSFPVKTLENTTAFYCVDCIPGLINWCERCGEAFEIDANDMHSCLCKDCQHELRKEASKQ